MLNNDVKPTIYKQINFRGAHPMGRMGTPAIHPPIPRQRNDQLHCFLLWINILSNPLHCLHSVDLLN